MRNVLAALSALLVSAAYPPEPEEKPTLPPAQVAAPCLRDESEKRYVVTWEIHNTQTGERRNIGSQEVRLRC